MSSFTPIQVGTRNVSPQKMCGYQSKTLEGFINEMEVEREAALSTSHQPVQEAPPSTSHQPVMWLKRDSDGNVVYDRPRSCRNQIASHSYSRKTGAHTTMLDSSVERTNYCPPDTVESFLEELNHSQGDDMDDQETAPAPPRASSDWSTRRSLLSERWAKERPRLVNRWHNKMRKLGSANSVAAVQLLSVVVTADLTHSYVLSVMSDYTETRCFTTGMQQ
ncbi:unnamed protein product [Arctogadus glacialis]